MKNVVKWVFGLFLSAGLSVAANAQTKDSATAPAEDAIVCRQVAENVFDCYVEEGTPDNELYYQKEDDNIHQQDNTEKYKDNRDQNQKKQEDIDWNRSEMKKRDSIDNATDVYNEKLNRTPSGRRTNPDDVHMNGDQTEYDKMYEYNHNKKKQGDPDNTDPMYNKEDNEIQAFK
jgi:hypothetical protein